MVLKPAREHATNNSQTYFVTSDTWERRALFNAEPWARLFFKTVLSHRGEAYLLHEFVLMPDHFHLLITPSVALERAVQLIKGGFSFRVKKEFGSNAEIWHRGFADHRIRDAEDYNIHVHYIHLNPVKKHLCETPSDYCYSSMFPGWKLDPIPQWLKPHPAETANGTAKAVPFQNLTSGVPAALKGHDFGRANEISPRPRALAVPFQNLTSGVPAALKGHDFGRANEISPRPGALAVPFQNLTSGVPAALKGHDFSRANEISPRPRALAPEGGER